MWCSLHQALRGREELACVILTARALGTWWTGGHHRCAAARGNPLHDVAAAGVASAAPLDHRGVSARAASFRHTAGDGSAQGEHPAAGSAVDHAGSGHAGLAGRPGHCCRVAHLARTALRRDLEPRVRLLETGGVCLRQGMSEPLPGLLPAVGDAVSLLVPTPERVGWPCARWRHSRGRTNGGTRSLRSSRPCCHQILRLLSGASQPFIA